MTAADAELEPGEAVFLDSSLVVATMKTHGIRRLATRNPCDFKRFHEDVAVLAVA